MATDVQDTLKADLEKSVEAVKAKPAPKPKAKATTKPKAQPKAKPVAEVIVPKGSMRPEALAKEIGISGKNLRGWLRKTHPRASEQKNTAWIIPPTVVKEAKAHFKKQEAA